MADQCTKTMHSTHTAAQPSLLELYPNSHYLNGYLMPFLAYCSPIVSPYFIPQQSLPTQYPDAPFAKCIVYIVSIVSTYPNSLPLECTPTISPYSVPTTVSLYTVSQQSPLILYPNSLSSNLTSTVFTQTVPQQSFLIL